MEAVAREVFRAYNYQEIRTPILEETALFARGVGEETDIVSKEMYTFEDRDGSSLTLRPEAPRRSFAPISNTGWTSARACRSSTTSVPCFAASARKRAATGSSFRSARKPSGRNRPRWMPK